MTALQKLEHYSTNIFQQVLFPGRGVPDPSIFRTHPHTKDRVARLQELNPQPYQPVTVSAQSSFVLPSSFKQVTRRPGWRMMNFWY